MTNMHILLPPFIAQPLFELFYRINRRASPVPPIRRAVRSISGDERSAFDGLLDSTMTLGPNNLIDYQLAYPKVDFLNYLCDWRGYVAHGSVLRDLNVLQPIRLTKDSSEFGNRKQIFSSPDAIWAIWFAILDKSKCHLTENGCVRVGKGQKRVKYYHFDLPAVCKSDSPFTEGMIYLANAGEFPYRHHYPMLSWFDAEVEEWGSANPVAPLARVAVTPQDFPYLDLVQFRL